MTLCTLGTNEDAQEFDSYTGGETEKKFLLHYNFPNFSVGETGRISGPGRREIGHGALAERSIEPMLPLKDYPYAIRITSEIMESNGSTSMASVCGGTLALMDAGVPMIRPVAGISCGICTEYGADGKIARYQLLTDILGSEDHFCDMDCKIAGTEKGITGFQLDLKLKGLPLNIMAETIERTRVARLSILAEMAKTIAAPRAEMSKYAPRIETLQIDPEKIGALIGPGGKNIRRLIDTYGVQVDVEDDGSVFIAGVDPVGCQQAKAEVEALTLEAEVGKIYKGHVVSIKEFGAFVEIFPGKEGLLHVSQIDVKRVNKVEDVLKIGDEVEVKCLEVDPTGKIRLSRKAVLSPGSENDSPGPRRDGPPREPAGRGGDRGGRGGDRGGRR
jgi:polyribonucleotide nucleotidyltransferase